MEGLDYFSDSECKEPYELCDHEYTTKLLGWKTCLSCGLEERYLSHTPEVGYEDRVFIKNTGPDHVVEIRKKMRELMDMVVRSEAGLSYEFYENFAKCVTNTCYPRVIFGKK